MGWKPVGGLIAVMGLQIDLGQRIHGLAQAFGFLNRTNLADRAENRPHHPLVDHAAGIENGQPFEDIPQLSDISGKFHALQANNGTVRELRQMGKALFLKPFQRQSDQFRNILDPLFQRGHGDREHIEPVIQIGTKPLRVDRRAATITDTLRLSAARAGRPFPPPFSAN